MSRSTEGSTELGQHLLESVIASRGSTRRKTPGGLVPKAGMTGSVSVDPFATHSARNLPKQ